MTALLGYVMMVLHSSVFHNALMGAVSAAAVDYHAFTTWHSFKDVEGYNWGVAAFRWVQGAVVGVVAGLGLGLVSM